MIPRSIVIFGAVTLLTGLCLAQFRQRADDARQKEEAGPPHWVRIEGGLVVNEDEIRTAREVGSHSSGTPNWTNEPGFAEDVFTFTRVIFQTDTQTPSPRGRFRWL